LPNANSDGSAANNNNNGGSALDPAKQQASILESQNLLMNLAKQ
jgi:hypothetical protein